ncbi:vacuolar protein sorting-associated protein 37A [Lampris incognitus]|uniref:vacuolar protein sorting-associated protein 37A n=1 Tax=Lampris incognitus TaxID=2546036 RepID=UPI0024B4A277|nr:vacuolar protein sorting-associated protein 37A [Lampris incognitus]
MNWLFPLSSKSSGPLPPVNSLQQQRQRQIESLKAAHASLAEIQRDVEYRIPFTVNNSTISVNVLLPPQFPQEKPVVSVYPPVGHHLVDSNNGTMVTSPLITNFGMHSDLGKVIQSLLDEFWKSPPVLMSGGSTGFPYNLYKPSGMAPYPPQSYHYSPRPPGPSPAPGPAPAPMHHQGGDTTHGPPRAPAPYGLITDLPLAVPTGDSQVGLNGHMYKMPEIPEFFPELSEMSVSQLKDMSEQEDLLLEFFVSLPQLKQVTSDKEDLVTSIVDLANRNLQMEPRLEGKRQEMLYKCEHLTQMKCAFETKTQRQHELSESCSLSALQARLKVAAHQAEEESEETAENFLEGRSEIDDFLASFMEKRTLCHSRRAKEEKLQQSINTHGQFPTGH